MQIKTLAGRIRLIAALALAAMTASVRASAAQRGELNIGVGIQGLAAVSSLAATQGATVGSINVTWTEPGGNGIVLPTAYDMRVSTLGNITSDAQFDAALPLSAFSVSPLPAPGPGGGAAGMVVSGLEPGVTYYFGLREFDSTGPTALRSTWLRTSSFNALNASRAKYVPIAPTAITDLAVAITGVPGQAKLTWTSPDTYVKVSSYTLVYSTVGAVDLAGDTTAWFNLAVATRAVIAPAKSSGSLESILVNALPTGTTVFFGIKSTDLVGQVSDIDTKAAGVTTQVKVSLQESISLYASTGAASGSIDLIWQEPIIVGLTPPVVYDIRVSTVANFSDNAGFLAAQPLSAFSPTPVPTPSGSGANTTLNVTGLIPGVTHYFGIRLRDSGAPPIQTDWIRTSTLSAHNFSPAQFLPHAPDAVTDLVAAPGAAEGDVALTWTAPGNFNFVPMASYEVRYATFSKAALAGDATAWFNVAAGSVSLAAQTPGSAVALNVGGLNPLATWYFAIRSIDVRGELSPVDFAATDGVQASTMPRNFAPPAPAGFTGVAGLRLATLSWTDLTPAQKGLAFGVYKLYRSTDPANSFVAVTTTTALSYVDHPLTALTTYYYKLSAWEGPGGLEGVATSTISVVPYTIAPQEPFGLLVNPSSTTVSITWKPTVRFADTTPFVSSSAPTTDELLGYTIMRSTSFCIPTFVQIATMSYTTHTFTENTMGNPYLYQIKSFNVFAPSTSTLILSSLGDMHFMLQDCASELFMSRQEASILLASSNTLGGDILISRRQRPEDAANGIVQSAEFRPMLNGVTELKNFFLPKPARIILRYATDVSGGVSPLGVSAAAADPKNLGMFWNNGAEFKKLYGRVDTVNKTVEVESPNLGIYQIRSILRADGAVFDVSNVSAKVITPNDDGLNDVFIVSYDPGPRGILPDGRIYDVRGAYVASMRPGLVPNTLTWDGRMNGAVVTGGVYVYQIKGDGKTFNGTIVIAR